MAALPTSPAEGRKSARVRLFVGGLGPSVSGSDLQEMLAKLGRVHGVEMVPWKEQGAAWSHRGFAYVDFEGTEASIANLMSQYHGAKWRGGKLRIERAKEHYLHKLQREWEARDDDDQPGPVVSLPDFPSDEQRLSKRPLPDAGLHIFFPSCKKRKFVPMKGLGKHKYSFQRMESLPLHLLLKSIDEKDSHHLVQTIPKLCKQQSSKQQAPRNRIGEQNNHAGSQQQLSVEDLEGSLRKERKMQLELCEQICRSQEPDGPQQMATPENAANKSPWEKLFDAAAGVGAVADVSTSSDVGDGYDSDAAEGGGSHENIMFQNLPRVKPPSHKIVKWKDLQVGGLDSIGEDEKRNTAGFVVELDAEVDNGSSGGGPVEEEVIGDTGAGKEGGEEGKEAQEEDEEEEGGSGGMVDTESVEIGHFLLVDGGGHFGDAVGSSPSAKSCYKEKWERLFEAAAAGLETRGVDEITSTAVSDGTDEGDFSSGGNESWTSSEHSDWDATQVAPGNVEETKAEKWQRLFEAVGGVGVAGSSDKASPSPKGQQNDDVPRVKRARKACGVKPEKHAGDDVGEDEMDRIVAGAGDGGATEEGGGSETKLDAACSRPLQFGNLDGGRAMSDESDGREGDVEKGICPAPLLVSTEIVGHDRGSDASETACASQAPGDKQSLLRAKAAENTKWMQKASWKSLVGEKGIVGFSLASSFERREGEVVQECARPTPVEHPVGGSSVGDKGSSAVKQTCPDGTSPDDRPHKLAGSKENVPGLTSGGAGEESGVVCTFMRSSSAHQDWFASKAKLRQDFKSKHKAARRKNRKMQPARRILPIQPG